MSDDALASTPGQLEVSRKRFARYYSERTWGQMLLLLASVTPWKLRETVGLTKTVFLWNRMQEHFENGCLNPAIVLDPDTQLIAVFTDLATGSGRSFPVIKIKTERLDLIDGIPVAKGTRLAAVALYGATEDSEIEGHWHDFYPIIVDCLVESRESCQEALSRLSPQSWTALQIGLKQVHDQTQPGLHFVEVPEEILEEAY